MGRIGGFNALALSTTYGVIGPFPGGGFLGGVGFVLGASQSLTCRISFVLSNVGEASLETFSRGSDVIMPGGTIVDKRAGMFIQAESGGSTVIPLMELYIPVREGSVWLIAAVFNSAALNFRFIFNAVFGRIVPGKVAGDAGA